MAVAEEQIPVEARQGQGVETVETETGEPVVFEVWDESATVVLRGKEMVLDNGDLLEISPEELTCVIVRGEEREELTITTEEFSILTDVNKRPIGLMMTRSPGGSGRYERPRRLGRVRGAVAGILILAGVGGVVAAGGDKKNPDPVGTNTPTTELKNGESPVANTLPAGAPTGGVAAPGSATTAVVGSMAKGVEGKEKVGKSYEFIYFRRGLGFTYRVNLQSRGSEVRYVLIPFDFRDMNLVGLEPEEGTLSIDGDKVTPEELAVAALEAIGLRHILDPRAIARGKISLTKVEPR